jgi:hypothetical protein
MKNLTIKGGIVYGFVAETPDYRGSKKNPPVRQARKLSGLLQTHHRKNRGAL